MVPLDDVMVASSSCCPLDTPYQLQPKSVLLTRPWDIRNKFLLAHEQYAYYIGSFNKQSREEIGLEERKRLMVLAYQGPDLKYHLADN